MSRIFVKKSGSALLTVILLIAVVGTMVLAGSKAIQESGRTAAVLSGRESARQMALTGIMEGTYYLNVSPVALTDGEYGTIVDRTQITNYSLFPLRRGFTPNSSCATQSAAEALGGTSAIDRSCPYYDLAIRSRSAYLTGVNDISKYALSSRDLPQLTSVTLPFRGTTVWLNVTTDLSVTNVSFALCTTAVSCGAPSVIARGGVYPINDVLLNDHYIRITANYAVIPQTPIAVVTASNSSQQVVLGKGYITVDVTGYSGDNQVHMLYTVRAGQPFFSEISNVFDQFGVLK